MPTQDVLASPATRRDRDDQEFGDLFTAFFPPLAHAVHRTVHDRSAAEDITCAAFLGLLTQWRKVTRAGRPDEWVRRTALGEAERVAATQPRSPWSDDVPGDDRADVAAWEERTEPAYAAVLASARQRTVRLRSAWGAAAAVVVALAAAVVLAPDPGPPPAPAPPPQSVSRLSPLGPPPWATEREDRRSENEAPRGALDGRWRTAPVTRADVESALRGAGLARYADYAATFPDGPFRIRLGVHAQRSVLTVAGDQRSIDVLRVEGRRATLEPLPPNMGFSYLRWSRDDGRLALAFTGSSMAKHGGYPAAVHLVALYATAPFVRY